MGSSGARSLRLMALTPNPDFDAFTLPEEHAMLREAVRELAEDKTDWRAKRTEARAAGDLSGMEEAVDGQMNKDLAQTAQENLAEVWKIIGIGKK